MERRGALRRFCSCHDSTRCRPKLFGRLPDAVGETLLRSGRAPPLRHSPIEEESHQLILVIAPLGWFHVPVDAFSSDHERFAGPSAVAGKLDEDVILVELLTAVP